MKTSSCKVPVIPVGFLMKLVFFNRSSKKRFMKIRPVGPELCHADVCTDGRTDGHTEMTKQIVAFCNIPNAPKK